MAAKRLTKPDWIAAGLRALADEGPAVLRAEVMARRLNTTKGSFYWHFRDLPDFHDELIREWKSATAAGLVVVLEDNTSPVQRLHRLATEVAADTRLEPAIRAWSRSAPDIAGPLGEIDALRLGAVQALLAESGVKNRDLGRAVYAAAIGLQGLGQDGAGTTDTLIDLVLALR